MTWNPKLRRTLRVRRITHGDIAGYWCLFIPGRREGNTQYGGKPLLTWKVHRS